MNIKQLLETDLLKSVQELYGNECNAISVSNTKKEFKGHYTLVVFPFLKISKKNPEQTATDIGNKLQEFSSIVADYNVIKGFLNISIKPQVFLNFLSVEHCNNFWGMLPKQEKTILVEYSSPNTNKPLHLGHLRNILLGYSLSSILEAAGNKVFKVNIVNDRGIHICKSMIAYKLYGNNETPQSSGIKGDHLVGKYYVKFDEVYKKQIQELTLQEFTKEKAEKEAPIFIEAQNMLRKWENGDEETIALWKKMNAWVYEGFDKTYKRMGVDFNKIYYESETYLLGKTVVKKGIENNVFQINEDGSVIIDLSAEGLDKKVVQRSDGTAVYITQDLGTAIKRYEDYGFSKMIYVVGNEQDYHFKVLFKILEKMNCNWASSLYHLSYGMVELPEGKMKSREGTVVDADDLMNEMFQTAKQTTVDLGKAAEYPADEADKLFETIGMGALKYFILKVDPKKKMLFNPKESIDFHGNTGPFIQYAYARIQSVLKKVNINHNIDYTNANVSDKEIELIHLLNQFPQVIQAAAENYSPAEIANYVYELAKEFNQFYHDFTIIREEDISIKLYRIHICEFTANVIKYAFSLLGINVPERM